MRDVLQRLRDLRTGTFSVRLRPSSDEQQPHLRVARLAECSGVHRAFQWLHLQELRIQDWQQELVAIPAPPFGEAERAAWMIARMQDLHLHNTSVDEEGNAIGFLHPDDGASPLVMLSAHLDTVFAGDAYVNTTFDGPVLRAPGAADNGAGLAGLLALAAALRVAEMPTGANIVFVANVGEEAEGNLRGMRYLFGASPLAGRLRGSIALEGAGLGTVVTRGLGSRRYRVTLSGPGGHAWTDAAMPNPIVALASAIGSLTAAPLSLTPRTTLNVGEIHGGTSVTSIPETASATFDLRSTDASELMALEVRLYRAVEDAVTAANRNGKGVLKAQIASIGDRPAGALAPDSRLLESVKAADRHLRLATDSRLGSTDANIPLAMGREAIAVGAGGTAGGIHTTREWYDSSGRDLALRRVLLLLLDFSRSLQPLSDE